jgi:hypothetical protein
MELNNSEANAQAELEVYVVGMFSYVLRALMGKFNFEHTNVLSVRVF